MRTDRQCRAAWMTKVRWERDRLRFDFSEKKTGSGAMFRAFCRDVPTLEKATKRRFDSKKMRSSLFVVQIDSPLFYEPDDSPLFCGKIGWLE